MTDLTRGYSDDIKALYGIPKLGVAKDELLWTTMNRVAAFADMPLRLYASTPADSKLNISANLVSLGDGSGLTVPPADNTLPSYPATTIDFVTGAITGGTVKTDYGTFTLPTTTVGEFRRMFLVYQAVLNQVNTAFSPAAASVGALQDPGLVSASLDGQVVGYIDLEAVTGTTYKTAGSTTTVIENFVGSDPRIFRFGSGGGGGAGGVGDTTAILESLKDQLQDSVYSLLTPVVFKVDKLTYIDGSSVNAAYSYVNKALTFSAIAGEYVSINLLDANEFLGVSAADIQDVGQVDLQVYWKPGFIDSGATYYVSRDGGDNWSEVDMTLNGYGTGAYYGTYKFLAEGSYSALTAQATYAATIVLNITTAQAISQSFTLAAASTITQVSVRVEKTGTPTGYLYAELRAISAGLPTETVYSKSIGQDISAMSTGDITVDLPAVALPAGSYCLVISTDDTYKTAYTGSNCLGLSYSASADGEGVYNGTTWSDSISDGLRYTITGRVLDLRLKVVSSSATSAIDGFGMFYAPSTGASSTVKNVQVFKFKSATDNLYSFEVTSFVIDKDLLKVYWAESGLCLIYPGFQISGNTIVFPQNTFYDVSDVDVTLVAQALEGSSFDNSDMNGALLTDAHLGSPNATLDRSVAGRGIYLRNAGGTLVELALDEDNNVIILDT